MTAISEPDLKDLVVNNMHREFTRLHIKQTVGEALEYLRHNPPASRVIYLYVVDDEDRLKGVIPTRRLLLSDLERPLAEIMVGEVVSIPHTATVLEACEFFVMHRLLAFPVVDADQRVLGVVDVELYTQEISELDRSERNDDLFQLIGVHLAEAQQASPWLAFRGRFPWLLCNIGGGILAALLVGLFEEELKTAVALALFIPVVLALAESVAIQSVSLALQVLRGERPTLRAIGTKIRREALTGALLGLASAGLIALVALVWIGQWRVALCLLAGIAGGVTCAAVIGAAIPNLLHLLERDPQVAAGPVALASADMVTLLVYFSLARALV
jgi:magnesium transporter